MQLKSIILQRNWIVYIFWPTDIQENIQEGLDVTKGLTYRQTLIQAVHKLCEHQRWQTQKKHKERDLSFFPSANHDDNVLPSPILLPARVSLLTILDLKWNFMSTKMQFKH